MELISPAEAAVEAAGFAVSRQELPRLLRLVARRLPADPGLAGLGLDRGAVAAALCEVRRKAWVARLVDAAQRAGQEWVQRSDALMAAAAITDPEAGEPELRAALQGALLARLRQAGPTPDAALDAVLADLMDTTGRPLTPAALAQLVPLVALAHGLPPDSPFVARATQADAERRRAHQDVAATARARRREEVGRLRDWERSLVEFREVPALLGCSTKEALRWVAADRIPVARRVTQRGGPKGAERWEFDPAELARLRPEVPAWRAAEGAGPAVLGSRAGNAAIARVAALDRYAAHFKTARALNRRITLITGPTNSGKSHAALDRLAGAASGLALAPLRLLAHEFREALGARGVPASLSTGEERIVEPGSRHLAATVEMCPFNHPVDVAIIDEAQMLHDGDRGAAWTAAIMGAPAREVFVLGAPECAPIVRRIAALCADPLEEITLQRKGPLVAAGERVGLGDLRAGDALVAFSRREVLDFRAELMQRGRRVAVVYGALSPEVRRAEAARFNEGDADVLVATDAIGMGLNLNIRRVVFGALRKFDGTQSRDLTAQEVKQIGGRAGRYGRHETGVVGVLAGAGSPDFVRHALAAPPAEHPDLRPLVQPDADIVRAVAAEIGSDSLYGVLARIRRAVLRPDDPNYRLADMSQAFAIAAALEGVSGLDLQSRWAYAMCPVDERDNGIPRLTAWAVEHGAGRQVPPPSPGRLPPPDRASREELERAEKRHKRLVAWRWLSLRFPESYPDLAEAEAATDRLDAWIENVLRQQRRGKAGIAA